MIPSISGRWSGRLCTKFLRRGLSSASSCDHETKRSILERLSQASAADLDKMAGAMELRTIQHLESILPAVSSTIPKPTQQQLKQLMVRSMIPFIGFGFVDNFILIIAGDYIDMTLGVSLGISSMAAAGIGNAISDVAGIGLGGVIEDCAGRLGLPDPKLLPQQLSMRVARVAHYAGCSVGITLGCILGMFPLLFLETKEDRLKNQATLELI